MTIYTTAQVAALHQYQFGPWGNAFDPCETVRPRLHPFTCPNRCNGHHFDNGGEVGILVPTTRGWICQCCGYTQNWAQEFMSTMPAEA